MSKLVPFMLALIFVSVFGGCGGSSAPAPAQLAVTSPATIPAGLINSAYTQYAFTATGGTAPYSWSVSGGSLPKGLSLSVSGVLTGKPIQAGTASFTIKVTDAASPPKTATLAATLVVSDGTVSVTTGASLTPGTVGNSYAASFAATGGTPPYSWSVVSGTLPLGLSLDTAGILAGTPTAAGSSSFTVRATDSASTPQSGTLAATLKIAGLPLSITSNALLFQGTVGQPYRVALAASGGTPPYRWSVAAGTVPPGLYLTDTGILSGTPTAAVVSNPLIKVTDSAPTPGSASLQFLLKISGGTLAVATTSLANGTQGQPYSQQLAASGGIPPYVWSATLPAGLSINSAGLISGTPTMEGKSTVSVLVSDSSGNNTSASAYINLLIGGSSLLISTFSLPVGQQGAAYSSQLTAIGGTPPYTWSLDPGVPLPAGLALDATGLIAGTPTGLSSVSPQFIVTDSLGNTATDMFSLLVNPAPAKVPDGTYAFLYNDPLKPATGSFTVKNGAITSALYDVNSNFDGDGAFEHGGPDTTTKLPISGGSFTVGSDGVGQLDLGPLGGKLAVSVPASVAPGSNAAMRFIGTYNGSGVLRLCEPNPDLSATKGSYAFLFSGTDGSLLPSTIAGSFVADGQGNITSGVGDTNQAGTLQDSLPITGTYSVDSDSHGRLNLTLGATALRYSFYEVSPNEWFALSLDPFSASTPAAVGYVVRQTSAPFSNSSLPAVSVIQMNGIKTINVGASVADVTLGTGMSDGNGKLTFNYDEYNGTLSSGKSLALTYTVDQSSGRVATTGSSGAGPTLYLIDSTRALVLGSDPSASFGILELQTGGPFTNTSFSGNYLGGSQPLAAITTFLETGLAAADGNGNLLVTTSQFDAQGNVMYQNLAGTYLADSSGRVVLTVPGDATPRIFYVISPTKVAYLSGQGGGYLGSFEQ